MSNPLRNRIHKHLLDEDVISAATDRQPSLVRDKRQANMLLRECSGDSGQSVYDHMSALIKRILDERPPNVIDYFEEFSRQVRDERTKKMHENVQHLRATYLEPDLLSSIQLTLPVLTIPPPEDFPGRRPEATANEEDDETPSFDPPNVEVEYLQFYWSLAGYGFPAAQVFILSCCLRKLREDNPNVISTKFWGQLYGLEKNYFVVEAELNTEEIETRVSKELQAAEEARIEFEKMFANRMTEMDILDGASKLQPHRPENDQFLTALEYPKLKRATPPIPKLPRTLFRPKRDIPSELSGTGLNRKTYFVCNMLGEKWTELPNVTPQQIQVARKIRKFLTGNLDKELWSYPIFPGVEKNYLRTMIARITSATYVAPIGYYRVGAANDEEEEEVDEEGNDNDKVTSVDPGYEPLGAKELLLDQSWTHIRPNVLKQGRINWFNPKDLEAKDDEADGEEEEAEGEEDEEGNEDEKEEVGPGLLTPCSEDTSECGVWTMRMSQTFNPSQSMVVIRSTLWPGAFSFAQNRNHDSLYVGWGLKVVKRNFSPVSIPSIESEYLVGPEVMEISDPSVEEEEEWRALHEKHDVVDEEEGEEGDMIEEGIEDNDDDD